MIKQKTKDRHYITLHHAPPEEIEEMPLPFTTGLIDVNPRGRKKPFKAAHPAFRNESYEACEKDMKNAHYHSQQQPFIRFRPATTAETLSILGSNTKKIDRTMLRESRIHLGKAIIDEEGNLYLNPPTYTTGGLVANTYKLRDLEKTHGEAWTDTYLMRSNEEETSQTHEDIDVIRDFTTVRRISLRGAIKKKEFLQEGLAKALENDSQTKNLEALLNMREHKKGVQLIGFEPATKKRRDITTISIRTTKPYLLIQATTTKQKGYTYGILEE